MKKPKNNYSPIYSVNTNKKQIFKKKLNHDKKNVILSDFIVL